MTINNNVVPAEYPLAAKALFLRQVSDQGRRRLGSRIPMPDITSQISGVTHHMQNIHRGLSVTRLASSMETHLFSRTRVQLSVFRKTLSEDLGKLVESRNWDTVTEYIMVTMTPVWEENVQNSPSPGMAASDSQQWL